MRGEGRGREVGVREEGVREEGGRTEGGRETDYLYTGSTVNKTRYYWSYDIMSSM